MKTYRDLYNSARENLIESVDKAKANYQGTPEELEDWVWQDLQPAIEQVVPVGTEGLEILSILRQHPDALKTKVELTSDSGTVQEILGDLLRNSLYADLEPEAKIIIDAAVDARRSQQSSITP
ncbi:hypothetical protein JP75_05240 [Devosia riboflavina]|uniref:Uncharacterized protein n=1 Tax=Devosia riboflavina TaxID=46914 RepID=A0A087M646_9HYPH|nr:hypothetical protein [Devosia riboflavina]KFL32349.1 hypothetical protein JP75_05240 [Devosia riboflavina]